MKTPNFWQKRGILSYLLTPISLLYQIGSRIDRSIQKKKRKQLPIPTLVMGNITMGGSGKTPATIALVNALTAHGLSVGVLSRGYGRRSKGIRLAHSRVTSAEIGDEPLLIYKKTGVPLAVDSNRYQAGLFLFEKHSYLDAIICDDGLQHHKLYADIEIAIIGRQGLGNGSLFPAGPLREDPIRLIEMDYILLNGADPREIPYLTDINRVEMGSSITHALPLHSRKGSKEKGRTLEEFKGQTIHAVAGIAYPENFFSMLEAYGINLIRHPFPDHYHYTIEDFRQMTHPILMTEKDAVKCAELPIKEGWVVPLKAELDPRFIKEIVDKIRALGANR